MSEFRLKGQFTEDASSLDSLDVLRYRRPTTLLPSEISELQIKRSGVFIFKLELTRVTSREVAVSVHRAPRGDAERFCYRRDQIDQQQLREEVRALKLHPV
ncbi:hypothetical protein E3U43_005715 [Larimichthys crocea]|uniref:Uncharacterized protein n=1 Tax=Larimichthys crocea TaxID=215358 RepID=A0ACD3QM42_LARCR|nr:hypothetical protein E3U43_005715 [Larimichthys crocea]